MPEEKTKALTVAELILHLQTLPQHLPVAYQCYSEYCLLSADEIKIEKCQAERDDGWVHRARPDKPSVEYVLFPGN